MAAERNIILRLPGTDDNLSTRGDLATTPDANKDIKELNWRLGTLQTKIKRLQSSLSTDGADEGGIWAQIGQAQEECKKINQKIEEFNRFRSRG